MNIKIYVATHKQFELLGDSEIYIPIQGGAELYPDQRYGYVLDNIGENISKKKENYNELTSLYWAWKNDFSRIKGLCHYRRYFTNREGNYSSECILNANRIYKHLKQYDVILPYPHRHKGSTNKYWLNSLIREENVEKLRDVIKNSASDYLRDYDEIMGRDYACYCNSLIASQEVFDEYAQWLFGILEKFEKEVDLSDFNEKERRIFGYVGEYLLNVWFKHNKKKIKFVPMQLYPQVESRLKVLKKVISSIGVYEVVKHPRFVFKHSL